MTKPFKIVLAGCGAMAHTWVKYALERQDADIVALVDLSQSSARALAAQYRLERVGIFSDVTEAIRAAGANLVFDVTVPQAHERVTRAALEAGCDVLGEKPMAASLEQARGMVALARSSGKTYAVMQNRRYLEPIRALRSLIAAETVGTPGFVTAEFFIGAHFGGFRDTMNSPLLLDMAIHTFDQARFITGKDPVSVYCHEFNPSGSWYAGSAAAACIFEFEGGLVFSYNGSWCAEGAPTSWEASWRISGSHGTALWTGSDAPYAEVVADPEQQGFLCDVARVNALLDWKGRQGHFGALDEMFAALLEGRAPETVCSDNIRSVAMVYGALESARTGRKVWL